MESNDKLSKSFFSESNNFAQNSCNKLDINESTVYYEPQEDEDNDFVVVSTLVCLLVMIKNISFIYKTKSFHFDLIFKS